MPSQTYKKNRFRLSKKLRFRKTAVKDGQRLSKWRGPTSYDHLYPIERSCAFVTNLNESTGFAGLGATIGIEFGLGGANYSINGGAFVASNIPSVTEFQALFDNWRLERVDVTPIFSANYQSNASASATLPVLYQVFDFDSVTGTLSPFEYPQCRTLQLGAINNATTTFTLWKPTIELVSGTTVSGATVDTQRVSPWLDTSTIDIAHRGIKFNYQNFGRTTSIDLGTILWQIKLYYTFKHVR